MNGKPYHVSDHDGPEAPPGLPLLIDTRLRVPLRADWEYYVADFAGTPEGQLSHVGYYQAVAAHARDMARLGWPWCTRGQWEDERLVPEEWLRTAVEPVPAEREADPDRNMLETYGRGFRTNAAGALWPSLPEAAFAASGSGSVHVWACPSRVLVVARSPGVHDDQRELDDLLLPRLVEAVDG